MHQARMEPMEVRRGIGSSGTRITGGCDLPDGGARNRVPSLLREQCAFLPVSHLSNARFIGCGATGQRRGSLAFPIGNHSSPSQTWELWPVVPVTQEAELGEAQGQGLPGRQTELKPVWTLREVLSHQNVRAGMQFSC